MLNYFRSLLYQLTRIADALIEQNDLYADSLKKQEERDYNFLEEPYYSRWLTITKLQKQSADKQHAYGVILRDMNDKQLTSPLPESETPQA